MSRPISDQNAGIDPIVEVLGFRMSTATVLFHTAIADRLGISVTDLKCYSLLRQTGPITAGVLAERVHLTTGAITGVIDRLEKAELVRRVRDPHDRRRVVLELQENPKREQEILQMYAPMGQAINELVASHDETQRAIILNFLTQATAILEQATEDLGR